jgi:hypothetical protein
VAGIPFADYDSWLNARELDPDHPLSKRLRSFFDIGADPDFLWALCRMLALANVVRDCAIKTSRRLADRKHRWRKESQALFSSHPGGKLRLTEVARCYTISVIRSTLDLLKAKGLIDSTVTMEAMEADDVTEIKEQALAPFAKMKGFPEDWDAAINESDYSGTSNLLAAVGASKITPEEANWLKELLSTLWPSIFLNNQTKRSDVAGTVFLLFVTEHLREKTKTETKKGKPYFRKAYNMMRSLQGNASRRIEKPAHSAKTRVNKLKKQLEKRGFQWQAEVRRFERLAQASRASVSAKKVN